MSILESVDQRHVAPDAAQVIEIVCPADGSVAGYVPDRSDEEVRAMVAGLRSAQPAWQELGPRGRGDWLSAFRDWLLDNERRLAQIVQSETGKSWGDATSLEVPPTIEIINYFVKNAERFLRDQRSRPHSIAYLTKRLETVYEPYQVVGNISPWNFPLAMPAMDIVPALMAGCAVISKPSEVTPLAWSECVRGWNEDLGAPPVLTCATGRGATGAAVVDCVDYVMFTGSTATGRKIAIRCAERLVPCSFELGGKDPMIVCADADLDRAARGAAWGALMNSGQVCVSVERVYVEEAAYDEFVAKLVEHVGSLRQGADGGAYAAEIGAMANEAQLEIVRRHVEDAVSKGARVLTGGRPRAGEGIFWEPTVLTDVDHSMDCMTKETFGPTIPVMRVRDAEEALEKANDSPYGLMGSIWTSNRDKAATLARRLQVGGVNINNVIVSGFQMGVPFGGWKESGAGQARLGGPAGLLKYCKAKAVVSDRVELSTEPHWYPYAPLRRALLGRAARALGARDIRRRLGVRR
jgi:acyl-CoA reductase-like NAD-dependent aldehyde dehydrogenase